MSATTIEASLPVAFARDGMIQLGPFCEPVFADTLHGFLARDMPLDWWFASVLPGTDGTNRSDIRAFPHNNPEIAAAAVVATDAFLHGGFSHYFYRTFPHLEGCQCLVCQAIAWLVSPAMVDMVARLTGRDISRGNAFFASCYTGGTFLSPHTDGDNGQVGLVWQLTRDWRPEYGGALHLLSHQSERVTDVIVPRFNTAILFDLPAQVGTPHFVSHVVPGVPGRRLAISGWYA